MPGCDSHTVHFDANVAVEPSALKPVGLDRLDVWRQSSALLRHGHVERSAKDLMEAVDGCS